MYEVQLKLLFTNKYFKIFHNLVGNSPSMSKKVSHQIE